ncbi:hypothetical protein PCC7424_1802 [Gloeothece citriformis PCC 7424]|uniref:Uncharacterized protein n=1 Tax=Gloeothece citriformis (strain PCC 7424) TaxID=65393 RepID=B7KCC9_GLOC7|nr:hypothetical protein [Gloeothece citriformis]ACK70234.1 hypothetical protein PCC7424_1802 [Gloeothece citriformis PCC 7424]
MKLNIHFNIDINLEEISSEEIKPTEKRSNLIQRLLKAAKAGTLAAIEQSLDHPVVSCVIAAVENLKQTGDN